MRIAKFCLWVCQVVFNLGVLQFSPRLLIGPFYTSGNNLERDVKLNKNIKIPGVMNATASSFYMGYRKSDKVQ